ncbi:MAG: hypothetical protein ACE149_17705 [Armatimonadota bacterium]
MNCLARPVSSLRTMSWLGALVVPAVALLIAGCGAKQPPASPTSPSLPVSAKQALNIGVPDYVRNPSAAKIQKVDTTRPLPVLKVQARNGSFDAISVHPFANTPSYVETQPIKVKDQDTKFVVYVILRSPGSENGVEFTLSADGKQLASLKFTPEMEKEKNWRRLEGDVTAFRGKDVEFRLAVYSLGSTRYDWAFASGFVLE